MKRIHLAIALVAGALAAFAAHAALNNFSIDNLQTGSSSFMRNAPGYIDARVLAANTSETHTVPTGVSRVIFSATCSFYAAPGASAAVPAADVTDGTAAELNPTAWQLGTTTQITVISASTCIVTMSFYK